MKHPHRLVRDMIGKNNQEDVTNQIAERAKYYGARERDLEREGSINKLGEFRLGNKRIIVTWGKPEDN